MAQVLPADDSFTSIATGNAGAPLMYLNHRPRTDIFALGYLHSGYQSDPPLAPNTNVFSNAAAAPITQGASLTSPRGFATQNEFAEDCTVRGVFRLVSAAGNATSDRLVNMGVWSRIKSLNEANINDRSVSIFSTSCYSLQLVPNTGGTAPQLVLRRFVAGAQLTVASFDFGQDPPNIEAAATLTLTAETNGAQVDLTGTFEGWGVTGGPITLTYTDNSADRITGTGRCGFSMGTSRLYSNPSATLIELLYVFEIEEDGAGVVYRDEFDRVNLKMGADLNWDGNSPLDEATFQFGQFGVNFEGQSLQQKYAWDMFTYEPNVAWPGGNGNDGAGKEFLTPGGVNAAFFSSNSGTSANVIYAAIAARPASDPRQQHRSVEIEMSSTVASSHYAAGICLRASYDRPTTNPDSGGIGTFRGYAAVVQLQSSSAIWKIRRYQGDGSVADLASFTDAVSGGTYFPAVGTTFVMDFEVYTEGDPDEGPTVLILKVDGVQVVLVGAGADASGTVRDTGSSRIREGAGEGMFFSNNEDNVANTAFFDDWAQQAIRNAVTKPEDLASISFAAQDAGATGSLNTILAPDFPFELERYAGTKRNRFESGHEQSIVNWTDKATGTLKERRIWSFRKAVATEAEYQALLDFYQAHEGGVIPFSWTPPNEATTYTVHFLVRESFEGLLSWVDCRSLAFKIQEL